MTGQAWPHQEVRRLLNVARVRQMLGDEAEAVEPADQALRIADSCGYRYYAMRARKLLSRVLTDEAMVARHERVTTALARSLAANLGKEDSESFLRHQGFTDGRP